LIFGRDTKTDWGGEHFTFSRRQVNVGLESTTSIAVSGTDTARLLSASTNLALHEDIGGSLVLELLHGETVHVGNAIRGTFGHGVERGVIAIVGTRLESIGGVQAGFNMSGSAIGDGDAVTSELG
jgi:hypothetical protein